MNILSGFQLHILFAHSLLCLLSWRYETSAWDKKPINQFHAQGALKYSDNFSQNKQGFNSQQRSHIFCPSKSEQGKLWRYRNYYWHWQSCSQHWCSVIARMWLHLGSAWPFQTPSPCSAFPLNTGGCITHVQHDRSLYMWQHQGDFQGSHQHIWRTIPAFQPHLSKPPVCVINFNNMLKSHWRQQDPSMCLHACLDESFCR